MTLDSTLLGAGILATGLMSGLLYGWSVSVIPGLRRVGDGNYVDTMQHINRAIINPLFVIPFMGIPLILAGASWAHYRSGDARRGSLLAASAVTYLLGVLGVTMGRNIPLNDALDAFDLQTSDTDQLALRRRTYAGPWDRWHFVRTGASIASFGLAAAAALVSASDA